MKSPTLVLILPRFGDHHLPVGARDAAQIAGHLGKSDRFDKALIEFSFRYADRNDADYALFKEALAVGRIEARIE